MSAARKALRLARYINIITRGVSGIPLHCRPLVYCRTFTGNSFNSITSPVLLKIYQNTPLNCANIKINSAILQNVKWYSSDGKQDLSGEEKNKDDILAKRKQTRSNLAKVLREYGTVAFVFHITMSLGVLSICYITVRS